MSGSGVEQYMRNEVDRDILSFVREFQRRAPVTAEAISGFLMDIRRRSVTKSDVEDRLVYLASAGDLQRTVEWQQGEFVHYQITAQGMDRLDGAIPPRNWAGK
jgi:hypothetical protein